MATADTPAFPLAIDILIASPHEAKPVENTIESRFFFSEPRKLTIGGTSNDSDPLDNWLRKPNGSEVFAPHKVNWKKPEIEDGRALRDCRRRWKVERLFFWLHHYRRLITHWEYHANNSLGML